MNNDECAVCHITYKSLEELDIPKVHEHEYCIVCGSELAYPDGIVDSASCDSCGGTHAEKIIVHLCGLLIKKGMTKEEVKKELRKLIVYVDVV